MEYQDQKFLLLCLLHHCYQGNKTFARIAICGKSDMNKIIETPLLNATTAPAAAESSWSRLEPRVLGHLDRMR